MIRIKHPECNVLKFCKAEYFNQFIALDKGTCLICYLLGAWSPGGMQNGFKGLANVMKRRYEHKKIMNNLIKNAVLTDRTCLPDLNWTENSKI